MTREQRYEELKLEVFRLVDFVQQIKREIASVKHPRSRVDHFDTVSEQLKAIVTSTEQASESIMAAAETILENTQALASLAPRDTAGGRLVAVTSACGAIFESCAFQDLTGQRISKIVRVMSQIENTLDAVVRIMGEKGMSDVPPPEVTENRRDGVVLEGPQLAGQGVSQADIDRMFPAEDDGRPNSQADIDALFAAPAPAARPKPAPAPAVTPKPAAPAPGNGAKPNNTQADIDALFAAAPPSKTVSQADIDKLFG